MFRKTTISSLFALGLSALAAGCDNGASSDGYTPVTPTHESGLPSLGLPGYQYSPAGTGLNNSATSVGTTDRTLDYGLALRTASIKLRGDLPTMVEIRRLDAAVKAAASDGSENDPQFVYNDLVRGFIYDEANRIAFNRQMMQDCHEGRGRRAGGADRA